MLFPLRPLIAVRFPLVLAGISLCVCWGLQCGAANGGVEVVEFGWNGMYHPGRWTPLRVSVTGTESADDLQFEVLAPDAEGDLNSLMQPGVPTRAAGEYELRCKLGRVRTEIKVRLLDGEEFLSETVFHTVNADRTDSALSLNRRLVGILTSQPDFAARLDEYFSDPELSAEHPLQVVTLDSAADLPADDANWASLDALILSSKIPLDASQSETLRRWVRKGGHLLLTLNSDPDLFGNSPLARWVPVELGKTLRLRDLSQFESYIGRSSRIKHTERIPAIELARYDGHKVLDSLDGTLTASLDYGFGQITVSGVDLSRPPFATWDVLPQFIHKLSFPGRNQTERDEESGVQQLTDSGITELATQLNLAQQDFPDVYRSNIWIVMAAIAVYLLLIGPLDYFLVHRVLKRPELTWVTFPVLLGLTAAVTVWAGRAANDVPLAINQVDLIDIDERQNFVRLKSWMTVYNSQTQRLAVESSTNLPAWPSARDVNAEAPVLSWDAVPEDGFGGLYRQSGFEFLRAEYHQDSRATAIDDLPVAQWSTRSLTTDQFIAGLPLVESELEASTLGSISGTVVHQLPGELVDWMLVYRRRVYFPKPTTRTTRGISISPNEPVELTRSDLSASRELRGFLTGTRQVQVKSDAVGEETRIVVEQEAYDLFSTDPKQILRILSFHEAAGGQNYTRLQNSALQRLDWSPYLHRRQAVLYAVLETPKKNSRAVDWSLNGHSVRRESHTTIVRCLLPVKLKSDERRELPRLDED